MSASVSSPAASTTVADDEEVNSGSSSAAINAAAPPGVPKGFLVTHTSYQQGNPPLPLPSPVLAPKAGTADPRGANSLSNPPLSPQLPPSNKSPVIASYSRQRSSSSSSAHSGRNNTPPLGPRTAAVPLITPRYQKKSRAVRHMNVTDSFPTQQTPSTALRQEAEERMVIQSGPVQYEQAVHFHTYDVYRHGKHHIHTRSVGYSSDGDLVMMREDYSEPSDVDSGFVRKRTEIFDPVVLEPHARRPLTEREMSSKQKIHINRPRYKKYPGIRIPKNRKVRNRLLNDYFAHEVAKEILTKARQWRTMEPDEPEASTVPTFADLPKAVLRAFDLEGDAQLLEFERLHVHPDVIAPSLRNTRPPLDPNSPEGRLKGLNSRLRGELQHALNSEYLTQQIEDLEAHFSDFIKDGSRTPESLVFHFRDGYGRLICHGVVAYYLLVSESRIVMDGSGTKLTYVSLPKTRRHGVRAVEPPQVPLLLVLKRNRHHLPSKHSLSAQTTPLMAPSPNLVASPPAEGEEREVMSPLDLNAPAMPVGGSRLDTSLEQTDCPNIKRDSNTEADPTAKNPTVLLTSQGTLPPRDTWPLYYPTRRLQLSPAQQEEVSAE